MNPRPGLAVLTLVLQGVLFAGVAMGAVALEVRAAHCGASILAPDLPYGIRPRWFNGTFWLEDKDGWGLITPAAGGLASSLPLQSHDGQSVSITRVVAYAYGVDLYVQVQTSDPTIQYAMFNSPRPNRSKIILLISEEFLRESDSAGADLRWHSVDVSDCAYGRFGVIRLILVTLSLALLVLLFRQCRTRTCRSFSFVAFVQLTCFISMLCGQWVALSGWTLL